MFNYVFLIVLCFMFVLYCLRLGIEFSRLMAHYKCILLLLLLLSKEDNNILIAFLFIANKFRTVLLDLGLTTAFYCMLQERIIINFSVLSA